MATFSCGRHTAEFRDRGGANVLAAAAPLTMVRWKRIRDDVSGAEITMPTDECCDVMADIRTVKHELHIYRDGEPVWEGVITRIEYEVDVVRVFAEDILWVAKKCIVDSGYNHSHPDIHNVIDVMHWQLNAQCYLRHSDPWRMTAVFDPTVPQHLFPIHHDDPANDPREARTVFPYSCTTWEDFDKYAEDYGADYTVVNRNIYYWDLHLAWKIIPNLDESFVSNAPRIVEYGNQYASVSVVTNGKGYAGMANAPIEIRDEWGWIEYLVSNVNESAVVDGPPEPEDVAEWQATAARNLEGAWPPPVAIVIPANSTLGPGSPWTISDLFPGAWFQMSATRLCRDVTSWQRLHEITVEETADRGETIQFTAIAAPSHMVIPAGG